MTVKQVLDEFIAQPELLWTRAMVGFSRVTALRRHPRHLIPDSSIRGPEPHPRTRRRIVIDRSG